MGCSDKQPASCEKTSRGVRGELKKSVEASRKRIKFRICYSTWEGRAGTVTYCRLKLADSQHASREERQNVRITTMAAFLDLGFNSVLDYCTVL